MLKKTLFMAILLSFGSLVYAAQAKVDTQETVDINTATVQELKQLQGIGEKRLKPL